MDRQDRQVYPVRLDSLDLLELPGCRVQLDHQAYQEQQDKEDFQVILELPDSAVPQEPLVHLEALVGLDLWDQLERQAKEAHKDYLVAQVN